MLEKQLAREGQMAAAGVAENRSASQQQQAELAASREVLGFLGRGRGDGIGECW